MVVTKDESIGNPVMDMDVLIDPRMDDTYLMDGTDFRFWGEDGRKVSFRFSNIDRLTTLIRDLIKHEDKIRYQLAIVNRSR